MLTTSTLSSHSIRPTSHSSENTIPPNDTGHSNTTSSPPPPHIRIVPHLESSRSLVFGVIERDVRENTVIKIGRFTDRFLTPNRITFRSKVVSRGHAELWTEDGKVRYTHSPFFCMFDLMVDKLYIRDTRSSSGTFLNHVRLSAPNQESKPFQLKDGDIIQLGVDYQGGYEGNIYYKRCFFYDVLMDTCVEIYRAVKMRIELNRTWQHQPSAYR